MRTHHGHTQTRFFLAAFPKPEGAVSSLNVPASFAAYQTRALGSGDSVWPSPGYRAWQRSHEVVLTQSARKLAPGNAHRRVQPLPRLLGYGVERPRPISVIIKTATPHDEVNFPAVVCEEF